MCTCGVHNTRAPAKVILQRPSEYSNRKKMMIDDRGWRTNYDTGNIIIVSLILCVPYIRDAKKSAVGKQ